MVKKILFTVNNDLNYDQRMTRICTSLATHGFGVYLIGKVYKGSPALSGKPYRQKRLACIFKKGKLAYLEYNLRLTLFLLFQNADAICAIDLDTILPVLAVSALKNIKRVYDAHELFTEMKEVISRPHVKKVWDWVERTAVPRFRSGYTVSASIAESFTQRYGLHYSVIRNMPPKGQYRTAEAHERFILYQGAVNEGRCLEYLIPSMKFVNAKLVICGDGNFMQQSQRLVQEHHLGDKVIFKGMLMPGELEKVTAKAYIGVNLVEPVGLNQFYSLANKFFDYIHAGLPQVSMDFPEYARINNEHKVALLISELDVLNIAGTLNLLLQNDVVYATLRANCIKAREVYNWQNEEVKLIDFYKQN